MNYLIFLLIGLVAGWIASILLKGRGYGMIINLILGVIGSFIGGTIFGIFGIHLNGFFGLLISATVGAIVLIWVVGLFSKK
ncbi:GlsB/YeaQ/YmgE family stress response membrane protein [Labilibaculum sp. A4]|uniref:Transglycosylase n=1 Tax=Labilibaculum manganireducens TaxID=1940525 RepID=A0A2N3IGS3_9BACT|nr:MULTISPECIES: GlsB/YeaQ/YmgE family stress response membrane protein [Labilibaculum]MBN2596301.1 GlsB/YeaQ/YmgE family stress response membrane protein [Marinifilaceae bacterium]MDQ1771449.1 GlsB/YeaQ/YmgE family stress response membrane protein [Labilibaculum euxinus]MWN76663.1 GlsB/YeaQ/YmgE family stress response membrane protein [Labilibaculum euxinus]PKQ69507.1 transglycosylase [Labilibaculum manganireducens]